MHGQQNIKESYEVGFIERSSEKITLYFIYNQTFFIYKPLFIIKTVLIHFLSMLIYKYLLIIMSVK
jgi:hypothetical protein